MNGPRFHANLVYRSGQQPPPRPHYSRQQMPPRPNYPLYEDYDDYEYRYDSTRPTPRSRRSMDVPRSDPRYGPAALVDEMYNRRLPHRSPTLHNQPIPPTPHQAYQHPPEPHRLSFDNAAYHLFNDLTHSRSFFGDLLDSFDREISGIKPYADAKIQETLWRKKIEKLDEQGANQQERLTHENHLPRNPNLPPPLPSGHPIQTFYSTASRLIDALKTAVNSVPVRTVMQTQPNLAPPPPPPGFSVNAPPPPPLSRRTDEERREETESMKRLIKKLQGQYRDLCDLVEGSKMSARKCSELIKDLGILLDVLNNSGNLWRQGGVEGQ
ncbi:Dimethyladenosine transferase [Venturia nashicola]|nr:Dimethyladenosine transferase [Venturia nashicola]